MALSLGGKVALVTGAGSMVGQAVALELCRQGAAVAALDSSGEAAARTVEMARKAKGTAQAFPCDITDRKQVLEAITAIAASLGPIDILVNSSKPAGGSPFLSNPAELIEREIAQNLTGHLWVTQAAMKSMCERKQGKIINIATMTAALGTRSGAGRGVAEGGLVGFTMSLAKELALYRINVNCVCAGPIEGEPPQESNGADGDAAKAMLEAIPMKRPAKPREIAAAVAFLASNRASYITGLVLGVDGGYSRAS